MVTKLTQNDHDRFYKKVHKSENSCWLWIGSKMTCGYGHFFFRGQYPAAHRVSWILNYGEIPDNYWVLHRCDVKACVRPEHLFLGTRQDNMDDMKAKQRQRFGEACHNAKATVSLVRLIRECAFNGTTVATLTRKFGLKKHAVSCIVKRETWKHVI